MFQKLIYFTFLFYFPFLAFSQNEKSFSEQDSIGYYLKKAKEKTPTFYLKKAVRLAAKSQIDSLILKTNSKYGFESYIINDTLGLAIAEKNLWKLYERTKDSIALARHFRYKGLICYLQFNTPCYFSYYQKSKDISVKMKDSLQVGKRLLSMAITQKDEKDYLGSEITTIEALQYLEPLKRNNEISNLYNNLGLILSGTNRNEEGRKYYALSNDIDQKSPEKKRREKSKLIFLNNIGITYINEEAYEKAIPFFKEGLFFDKIETKYPNQYQLLLGNLAFSYFQLGKNNLALDGYQKALVSAVKNKNFLIQSSIYYLISKFYLSEKQFKKALFYGKKGLMLAKKIKQNEIVLENLYILSDITKGEQAKNYLKEYVLLNDSLFERERNMKNQFAKVRYETEKKDKENHQLKEENTKKQLQITKERQQKIIASLLAGISLLFIGFASNMVKNRRKKLLFEAQLQNVAAREKERQQIAKTLHDEVAGDLRMLHQRLERNTQKEDAQKLDAIKENVRNLSHRLSSVHFNEVSFKDQMINLAGDCFENNFRVVFQGLQSIDWKPIDSSIKRVLYLSCRESIQNTQKYAATAKMQVVFEQVKKEILLTLKDEGKGFDVAKAPNGIGLKNMKERVEDLQGTFAIESEQNKGTTIKIKIPIDGKTAY